MFGMNFNLPPYMAEVKLINTLINFSIQLSFFDPKNLFVVVSLSLSYLHFEAFFIFFDHANACSSMFKIRNKLSCYPNTHLPETLL